MDRNEILLMRLSQLLNEIRQYVGARYVPRFIDGGWDATQAYEALDVVDNGQGTSYIAKKPVPVGTPLSNREYWFVYGASSGAIINLQQQIDAIIDGDVPGSLQNQINNMNDGDISGSLQNQIDDINDSMTRRYIIITDSYGGYRDSNNERLIDIIGDAFNAAASDKFVYGGAGFTNVNGAGTFESLFSAETISDPDTVTDIVIIGGQNDYGRTFSTINDAIADFISYCNTAYPNALVSIANATKSRCLSSVNPSVTMFDGVASSYFACLAYRNCIRYGARYLQGTEYIMHNSSLYEDIYSPHPNATGVTTLAIKIIEAIKTGKCSVYYSLDYDLNAPTASGYTVTPPASGTLTANVIDGITQLNVSVPQRRFTITFDSPRYMPSTAFDIGVPSSNNLLALGQSNIPFGLTLAVDAYCVDSNDEFLCSIPGNIRIGDNGQLIAHLQPGITENPSTIKIAYIVFKQTVASYQSILC